MTITGTINFPDYRKLKSDEEIAAAMNYPNVMVFMISKEYEEIKSLVNNMRNDPPGSYSLSQLKLDTIRNDNKFITW